MKWISVDEQLPKIGIAVLVKILDSDRPALAVLVNDTGRWGVWKVQPLFTAWYTTGSYVTHWAPIEIEEGNRETE